MSIIQFMAGVGLLVGGAYALVDGGCRVAAVLKVPAVIVGLTVVAFGTSAPEFFVSAIGVLKGNTELVLGNVIGSNVANIGLILALAAIMRPVVVEKGLAKQEVPLLVGASLIFTFMARDNELGRLDGAILTILFLVFLTWTIKSAGRGPRLAPVENVPVVEVEGHRIRELTRGSFLVLLGMVGLAGGGHFIVQSATTLAKTMGVSDAVIGLTLVAVGTSLPELATTLMAAWKDQDDMALGNIIGSNLFNILAVAGPIALFGLRSQEELMTKLLAMCILTLVMALMIWPRHGSIGRVKGWLLLSMYAVTMYLWVS